MFPEQCHKLTTMFVEFKAKVIPFLKSSLKTSTNRKKTELIDKFNRITELDCQTSDFLVMYYLPMYIKPTKHVKLSDRNLKPSITESQDYFIRLIPVSLYKYSKIIKYDMSCLFIFRLKTTFK